MSIQEIKEHHDQFGISNLITMNIEDYRRALYDGAYFWIDHHDFLRSTLSGEIFATNRHQLDVLIEQLSSLREKMMCVVD
ncbi:hypothetical protein [Kosakonia cowanii]|uniref:hypothetical protein n=1 Tax=Kosakonia cowanii TaxID=208223 RepID=UPI003211D700